MALRHMAVTFVCTPTDKFPNMYPVALCTTTKLAVTFAKQNCKFLPKDGSEFRIFFLPVNLWIGTVKSGALYPELETLAHVTVTCNGEVVGP